LIFFGDTPRKSRDCSRLTDVLLLLAASHSKFGLDAGRMIAQFYYTAWTIEDGTPSGAKRLAQTWDGYLWIETLGDSSISMTSAFSVISPCEGLRSSRRISTHCYPLRMAASGLASTPRVRPF
jgi:hypothetical protein